MSGLSLRGYALTAALLIALPAFASKPKNEQYSATEEEGGQPPETRPLLMPSGDSSEEAEFAGPAIAPPPAVVPPSAPAPLPQIPTNPNYPSAPAQAYNAQAPAPVEAPERLVDSDSVPLPLPPPPYGAQGLQQSASPAAPRPTALTVPVVPPPPPPHEDVVPFDPVPKSQKVAIRKRIQLVDRMIAKYGRAYDYRTHTLRELQNILAELEAQAKQRRR